MIHILLKYRSGRKYVIERCHPTILNKRLQIDIAIIISNTFT